MAILAGINNDDELVISCKCGCNSGIHIKIDNECNDDYFIGTYMSGNYYSEQKHPIIEKIKKIWAIIRNKDFYYSEICMSKNDFQQFKLWINRK